MVGTVVMMPAPTTQWGRSLELELLRAAKNGASITALIRAVAALDLTRAVRWLSAPESRVRALASLPEIIKAVDHVAGEISATRDRANALLLAELLERNTDFASPASLRALSEILDESTRVRTLGTIALASVRRYPKDAEVLRLAAEAAVDREQTADARSLLRQLSEAVTTPAAARIAERLYSSLFDENAQRVNIALLSSFTVDPLRTLLSVACRSSSLEPDIHIAPYNSWEREMRNGASELFAFKPDVAFLNVAIDDLIPELTADPAAAVLAAAGDHAVARVGDAVRAFRAHSHAACVVHSFRTIFGQEISAGSPSRQDWLRALNIQLGDTLRTIPNTYLLDSEELIGRAGVGADDPTLRHLARVRMPAAALKEVARAYVRFLVPFKGLTRKCVVLDLDNTLWGGVVGEDGISGIRIGDSAPGSEFVELQQYLKALTARGFMLAIASKNNEADALHVIRTHDAMVLREQDFVTTRINWSAKPESVRSIAEELGIGLDSIVFVDDNPSERELMRQTLPQVLTVEMPTDPAHYRRTLERLPELQRLHVTGEDRQRTDMYRARRQREEARANAISPEDFLASLEIVAEIDVATEATSARVQQLFERTNQFNLTKRRYELAVVQSRREDAGWRIYTARASDRFSDHGLVGSAMVRIDGDAWHIDNLVLSCRVIGHGIETALITTIAQDARAAEMPRVTGELIRSARNAPAQEFYSANGFTRIEGDDEKSIWSRDLSDAPATPTWITLRRSNVA